MANQSSTVPTTSTMNFPTEMNPMQLAIDLNGKGVFSLVSGQASPKATFTLFRETLNVIDGICRICQEEEEHMAPKTTSSGRDIIPLSCTAVAAPALQDECFYIFNLALVFHVKGNISSCHRLNSSNAVFSCTLTTYNMALFYHQLALQTSNERNLRKARVLYGKSIDMANAMPRIQVGDDLYMLQLVAHNNRAQIEYTLQLSEACQRSLFKVRAMATKVIRSGRTRRDKGSDASFVLQKHLDEIVLNTMVLSVAPVSAPTA